MRRRHFLASSLAAVATQTATGIAQGYTQWSNGRIQHLLPVANHSEIQLKVVFRDTQPHPTLRIGEQFIPGLPGDSEQTGWTFHTAGLNPDTKYELSLWHGQGHSATRLSDPWPLKTFPHPDARPEHARLLVYTCAGGHPLMSEGDGSSFLPMTTRRALLDRGLSFKPDAVIAIGDQIYWDQRTILDSTSDLRRARGRAVYERAGLLDRTLAAAGTNNEDVLKLVAGQQIQPLYGVKLRSTPAYFINDDHDYFENDEATKRFVTLPPYDYQVRFSDYVRNLYLPNYLSDPARSRPISGDRRDGTNASFGTLRWGNLLEVLMYDCAGHLSLKGVNAGLIPPNVERWLQARTANPDIRQLLHLPSHPMGWSAGKWREWYPDVADTGDEGEQIAQIGTEGKRFRLTNEKPKFMWQQGWWRQHQRLLKTLSEQTKRPPIMMSGDLHATGHAQITRSGNLNMTANPVNTMITGPLGTGTYWPSRARGTLPTTAIGLQLTDQAPIQEKNGFTIVDAYPDHLRVRLFAWRRETNQTHEIENLAPYHDIVITR